LCITSVEALPARQSTRETQPIQHLAMNETGQRNLPNRAPAFARGHVTGVAASETRNKTELTTPGAMGRSPRA
jgi:hypothetical protein